MDPPLLPPQNGVESGFPLTDRRGRQIVHAPLSAAQVVTHGDRDLVAAAFVAKQQVELVGHTGGVGENLRAADGDALRAWPAEAEWDRLRAGARHPPRRAIVEHDAVLRDVGLSVAPVRRDVRPAPGVGRHRRLVDQFVSLRDRHRDLRSGGGDGQRVRLAGALLPRRATVDGPGVAEVMVGRDVARLPPDPGEVQHALVVNRRLPVGVALTLAVDEVVMQLAPSAGLRVVAVHDQIAAAGRAVAVDEEQPAVGEIVELRVGDARFAPAGHRQDLAQLQ